MEALLYQTDSIVSERTRVRELQLIVVPYAGYEKEFMDHPYNLSQMTFGHKAKIIFLLRGPLRY